MPANPCDPCVWRPAAITHIRFRHFCCAPSRSRKTITRVLQTGTHAGMTIHVNQRQLRKGRWSERDRIYHITTTTRLRAPAFADFDCARILINCLREEQLRESASTLAFVVMPDHLHWLFALNGRDPLSTIVARVKSGSARRINRLKRLNHHFGWQTGFHDRALRDEDDVKAVARYVVSNPVRAGLVGRTGDYPHWDAAWVN